MLEDVEASETETVEDRPTNDVDSTPEGAGEQKFTEEDYKNLQADYTRKSQTLKQYEERQADLEFIDQLRGDPEFEQEFLRALAGKHGYEFDEPEVDPLESVQERVERLEQERLQDAQRAEEEREDQEQESFVVGELERVSQELGRDLDDDEIDFLVSASLMNRNEDGRPNVQGAYEKYKRIEGVVQKRLIESKKAPQASHGVGGEHEIDRNDKNVRRELMAKAVSALD